MAHKEQRGFCLLVREQFSNHFFKKNVLEVGSLDINGNNNHLFRKCNLHRIDLMAGKNVDQVVSCKDFLKDVEDSYDTIITTNALEHDRDWKIDLELMYRALKPGGLLLISAAGVGWREHGTYAHTPWDSPATNDYYENISVTMAMSVLRPEMFSHYIIGHNERQNDFQFFGIKVNPTNRPGSLFKTT